mgnify:CR=1 FL=1
MKAAFKPAIDDLFESNDDWKSIIDVLNENNTDEGLPMRSYTKEEIRAKFDALPDNIQFGALEWGIGDTEVRDNIYVFYRDKKDS